MQDPSAACGPFLARRHRPFTPIQGVALDLSVLPDHCSFHKCVRCSCLGFSMDLNSSKNSWINNECELVFISLQCGLATDEPIYFQKN